MREQVVYTNHSEQSILETSLSELSLFASYLCQLLEKANQQKKYVVMN